jgi:hypothetical protein
MISVPFEGWWIFLTTECNVQSSTCFGMIECLPHCGQCTYFDTIECNITKLLPITSNFLWNDKMYKVIVHTKHGLCP